jgi:AcrR family transcriptional regulator
MARDSEEIKRRKILETAVIAFGDIGYRGATIRGIAERIGVASGTLYTYFPNKEELFRAAIEQGWGDLLGEIDRIMLGPGNASQRFITLVDSSFEVLRAAHPLLRSMFSETNLISSFRRNLESLEVKIMNFVRSAWDESAFEPSLRYLVKMSISGVLFETVSADPAELDAVMGNLKKLILAIISRAAEKTGAA